MVMEIIRYTPEELLHLRESPLIQKPDGLPSIEQWMEQTSVDQGRNNKTRTQGGRNDEQAGSQENGSQRPSLFQTKHFTRHSTTVTEDIVLGPPKVAFASSSRVPKLADLEKDDDVVAHDRANLRDKFFKDREVERNKTGNANGRRAGREEGEGWTSVRARRASLSQDDQEQLARIGEHRSRFSRDGDEETPRRNGTGRNRFDQPWGRDTTNTATKEVETPQTAKSWRDRDWTRGNRIDEDPEWMDTPAKKKEDVGMARFQRQRGPEWMDDERKEEKKAHTQEDFQRWKEKMKAGASAVDDKENAPEPALQKETPVSSKPITPLAFEGKDMFGMFSAERPKQSDAPATTEGAAVPKGKPAKASRFAKLFSPQEEQPQPSPEPQEPTLTHQPTGSSEDKEGFQRILQMLGGTTIATQSPSPATVSNGRKSSVFSPVEDSSPPPEREAVFVQPQPTRHHILRSREEKAGFIEQVLAPRGTSAEFKGPGAMGPFSPDPELGQGPQIRKAEGRLDRMLSVEDRIKCSPSNNLSRHGNYIQNVLHAVGPPPPREPTQLSRDREFLLNLMTQAPRNTPPAAQQGRPPPPEAVNFGGIFLDQKGPGPQPKPAQPPPGLFEERQFPENDVRYQPRRGLDSQESEQAMRRAQRFNLPMYLDDPAIAGMQRRNTADGGPVRAQLTNMGIPQQGPAEPFYNKIPPGLQPDRPPVSSMAPPPGFPPSAGAMRGPPGFGGPAMGMPPFSTGNTPLGHPGMQVQRGPPSAGPTGMFPPQGPPPGYFSPPPPPPGFAPGPGPMGMGLGSPQEHPVPRMGPPGMVHPMFLDRPVDRRNQGQGQGPFGL